MKLFQLRSPRMKMRKNQSPSPGTHQTKGRVCDQCHHELTDRDGTDRGDGSESNIPPPPTPPPRSSSSPTSLSSSRNRETPNQAVFTDHTITTANADDRGGAGDVGNIRRTKMVRFPSIDTKLIQMKQISRLSSKALVEMKAVWGHKNDTALRKQQLKHEIRMYQQGRRDSDNETFTTIGIEEYLNGTLRKATRKCAVETVLNKQQEATWDDDDKDAWGIMGVGGSDRSRRHGKSNRSDDSIEEQVAKACRAISKSSQQKAHQDALYLHESIMS